MIKRKYQKADTLAPKIVTAQFMFYANAALWLGFGIYVFVDMLKVDNFPSTIFLITFFLLVNVSAMIFCAVALGKRNAWAYYFSIFIIILNAFFTRVGGFEVFDIIAFLADVALFIFLVMIGKAYLTQAKR
ncbi:MAG: hypothetical protein IT311_02865 [Anaerolineales bacterium]|nr:hypothetical protein [Anaerolineales bacterium]MCZ2121110.1 hypothetical protein [Anaerolineales bacterium]